MSNQWISAGASDWLDAVLYDSVPSPCDILLATDLAGDPADGSDRELYGLPNASSPSCAPEPSALKVKE